MTAHLGPLDNAPTSPRPPFDARLTDPVPVYDHEEFQAWRERRREARRSALLDALDGIPLGEYDRSIVEWVARGDTGEVGTIVSWILRAREAGR